VLDYHLDCCSRARAHETADIPSRLVRQTYRARTLRDRTNDFTDISRGSIRPSIACSMLSRSNFVARLCRARSAKRRFPSPADAYRLYIVSYRSEQSGASGEGNAKQRAREWRYESPPTRRPHLGRIASIIPARAYEMLFNLSSSRSDGALVLPFLRFFLRGVGNRSRVQGFSLARRFARIRVFPFSPSLSLSLSLCLIVASR